MSLKVTPSTITGKLEVKSSNNTINTTKYYNYYNGTRGDVPEVSTTESRRNMFQQSDQRRNEFRTNRHLQRLQLVLPG